MRKFMDYYLPTSLKLLNTYAELDKQGIEGENISESKHRIEQTMDTLVKAFENAAGPACLPAMPSTSAPTSTLCRTCCAPTA